MLWKTGGFKYGPARFELRSVIRDLAQNTLLPSIKAATIDNPNREATSVKRHSFGQTTVIVLAWILGMHF